MTQKMPARLKFMALLSVCLSFYLVWNKTVILTSLGIVDTWSDINSMCEALKCLYLLFNTIAKWTHLVACYIKYH